MTQAQHPAQVCAECDRPIPGDARFCAFCGRAVLGGFDALPAGPPVVAELSPDGAALSTRPPPSSGFPLHERATEPPPTQLADPLIGRTIADRYHILEQIGRGGMGVVYRVEHARIGKLMALKLLTGELTRDGVQVARFKREALMASRLSHPNTVQVFDFGTADGLVYLAMEYLRGEDLGRVIRREGALSAERTERIVVQIANSLAEAHEKGIVHRDLKPENIVLVRGHSGEELVKVLDFGLARLRESSELSEVTSRGAIVGTPYYMSPEQIRGENPEPSSDVYSLGALTYACLTGVPVFDANTPLGVFTKHLLEQPVPPRQRRPDLHIPDGISRLVTRTLEKDPERRPRSVSELRDSLIDELKQHGADSVERLLSSGELSKLTDDGESATRAEVERYEKKLRRRSYVALFTVGALVLGLLGAGGVALRRAFAAPVYAGRELEPNDSASQATVAPFGEVVLGRVGQRLDRERSDRDFFRITVPPGARAVRLFTSALPNMALCTWVYAHGSESALGRYCVGAPGRDLDVAQLLLAPGEYVLGVMQDRDAYSKAGAPPVHENVSDDYRLELSAVTPDPERELEPNDTPRNPSFVSAAGKLRGRLGFMRDTDVICATGPARQRFELEEPERARPRESVLEVTPLAGADKDVPVRVHKTALGFTPSPRDVLSPYRTTSLDPATAPACIQLRLVPNPWAPPPLPDIAPASDAEYTVHVLSP